MQHAERRIRHLRLSGGDHARLRWARHVLEEAFRTASLPGIPPHAEVLIRRLELGTLSPALSATALAGRIATLVRNLAAGAVCVDERAAPSAAVVWFSDPLRPHQHVLLRVLDGGSAPEWYWRSLFPMRDFSLQTATIDWLLRDSCRTPARHLAPLRLMAAVIEAQRFARLHPFITPLLAHSMLHEAGMVPAPGQRNSAVAPASIPPPPLNARWRAALTLALETWGETDVRSRWLAWQALVLHRPAWLECRDCLPRIEVGNWLTNDVHARHTNEADEGSCHPVVRAGRADESANDADGPGGAWRAAAEDAGAPPSAQPVASDPGLPQERAGGDVTARTLCRDSAAAVAPFSLHAGFALVIPVLQRLGMAELLKQNERLIELDFPRQLLWALARRMAIARDDPLWRLFTHFESGADVTLETIQAPASWPRLIRKPLSTASLHALTGTAQMVAGAYLRRACRLSLRGLIGRPGNITLTATHWDVYFDIDQTDLRLRRVALDSDPGWVPWLGRVVQFHYDYEG